MTEAEVRAALSRPLIRVPIYAQIFDVSVATAYEACHCGEVETVRVGKKTLWVVTAPLRRQLGLELEAA